MRFIYFILLSFCSLSAFNQTTVDFSKIYLENKGSLVAEKLGPTVDLNINGIQSNFKKNQAKVVLNKFFKEHNFLIYKSNHTGGGGDRPYFEIGELLESNKKYRTYVLFQEVEKSVTIIELRIEEE